MTSFIAKVRERRAEITAQIAALVAERDELDAVERVYVRLSGDGADIAGDEPADHFPNAGKMVAANNSPEASGTAREAPGGSAPSDGNADLSQPVEDQLRDGGPVAGSADLRAAQDGAQHAPHSHLQHDAGGRADTDTHNVSTGVTSGEKPAQNPVANVGEGADGTKLAASVDPASRETDDAGPQRLAASGFTEGAAGASPNTHRDEHDEPVREASAANSKAGKPAGGAGASPAAPRAATGARLIDKLTALHAEHPDWTAGQFHAAMPGTNYNSVSTMLTIVRKAASREPVQPVPEPEASEPAPEPERRPAVTAEPAAAYPADSEPETIPSFLPSRAPIAVRPSGSSSAVITKPMAHAPKGALFYLCDDEGRYLHGSCTGMTTDRTYAWQGSAEQLFNCRKKFPLARDLSERVVNNDMPAPINREVA